MLRNLTKKFAARAAEFDIKKQEKRIFFFFLIGIVFYSILVLFVDIKKIAAVSSTFYWPIFLVLIAFSTLNYFLRFLRWQFFLRSIYVHISYVRSFRIFLSGLAMTVTPGKMGEVIKAYLVKKETGTGFAEITPLLIIERVTDGIGMIILALGGIYLFRQSIIFFAFALLMVIGFFIFMAKKNAVLRFIKKFEHLHGHTKLLDFLVIFFEHSGKLLKKRQMIVAIIYSVIAWGLEGVALFILINAFGPFWNMPSLLYSLLIFSFASIAGFVVLIPGGIGVAEGTIASLLILFFHFSLPEALFIAILFRFATLWYGVFLGLINLFVSFSKSK